MAKGTRSTRKDGSALLQAFNKLVGAGDRFFHLPNQHINVAIDLAKLYLERGHCLRIQVVLESFSAPSTGSILFSERRMVLIRPA